VPSNHRLLVLAIGVAISAFCLLSFTAIGSVVVSKFDWIKPIAGIVLVVIGVQLIVTFWQQHGLPVRP
jgi:predicted tellurium resistance membrane protein TerC